MLSDEHIEREEITPHRRGLNLELFYYEQVGSRSYLRVTRLGLILILILTVLPVIALLSIFLLNQSTSMPNVDVTIKPMPTANASAYPTVHQPIPPPAPKALRQSKAAQPVPPALPSPIRNSNER
jgi:hypothetical protein